MVEPGLGQPPLLLLLMLCGGKIKKLVGLFAVAQREQVLDGVVVVGGLLFCIIRFIEMLPREVGLDGAGGGRP